jgi:hypothetical protein
MLGDAVCVWTYVIDFLLHVICTETCPESRLCALTMIDNIGMGNAIFIRALAAPCWEHGNKLLVVDHFRCTENKLYANTFFCHLCMIITRSGSVLAVCFV